MNHEELFRLKKCMGKTFAPAFRKVGNGDVSALVSPKFKRQWCIELLRQKERLTSTQRFGGYTLQELNDMDEAFNHYNSKSDPDCFLGMSAVFNVLCRIHEVELRGHE
jgi:hypothetical protein